MAREIKALTFHRVPLKIQVEGNLYASSPASAPGIEAALRRNMPTEAQLQYREEVVGENIKDLDDIRQEMEQSAEMVQAQEVQEAHAIFRRDLTREGKPYLHANYLKGHIRGCGRGIERAIGFWALERFITMTVLVAPARHYLEQKIQVITSLFAPEVRTSAGIMVRQNTIKRSEYIQDPILHWVLYLVGDPRWTPNLLEDLFGYGSMRGFGPGRGILESQYAFELGTWETLVRRQAMDKYRSEFMQALGMSVK